MTATPSTAICVLASEPAVDPLVVGSKAARLGQLRAAGFPVPDGVVLPASLLAGWRADTLAPAAVIRAVEQTISYIGDGPLAVRSSADAEDGAAASFAGVYATVLGAIGVEEVTAAVRTCLDSADAARLDTYRGGRGARMSVLVQPLLAPEAAGVAFTADPVTGEMDAVRISAVSGLGGRLVDGTAMPDELRVDSGVLERLEAGAPTVLTAEQAEVVAELAKKVENHFGEP